MEIPIDILHRRFASKSKISSISPTDKKMSMEISIDILQTDIKYHWKVRTYDKGLGHAIWGNFSTDQMVIELTKLSQWRLKTAEELKQNTGLKGTRGQS